MYNINNLSPIAIFTYKNTKRLNLVLKSLIQNKIAKESKLFIFQDYDLKTYKENKIEKLVLNYKDCFKSIKIIKAKKHKGLVKNIVEGINYMFKNFEKAIFLEDDITVSKSFLYYMNGGLNEYKNNKNIFSITGFNNPKRIMRIPKNYKYNTYLNNWFCCWGWATWKSKWKSIIKDIEFNNKNTWAEPINKEVNKNKLFNVYPIKSLVNNIGNTSGIHGTERKYDILLNRKLNNSFIKHENLKEINYELINNFMSYFNKFNRAIGKIKMCFEEIIYGKINYELNIKNVECSNV